MKIILIRHAAVSGNLRGKYIGSSDEPLCEYDSISGSYPPAELVITSPMKRCIQTADFTYPDITRLICGGLRERSFGCFENKSYEDLKDNPLYREWIASEGSSYVPDAETSEAFTDRCVRSYFDCVSRAGGRDTAFVIHGGTIMAIMRELFGGSLYDYQPRNGGGYIIESGSVAPI